MQINMKILIYGSAKPNRIEDSYKRAFTQLGHSVDIINVDKSKQYVSFYLNNRLLHRLFLKSYKIREKGAKNWNYFVKKQLSEYNPDIFFVFKGDFLFPKTLHEAKSNGTKVIVFNPDSPLPGNPNHRPEHIPLAKEADFYFIWSKSIAEQLQKLGAEKVEHLPFAWDPGVYPYKEPQNPEYDVVFIGGWNKKREQLLEVVGQHFDLKIWGPDYWQTRTSRDRAVRKAWMGKPIFGEEASEVISKSKIVLNILRDQNLPDGTNMRTFEVPGAGGFLLSNYSSGADELFPEGEAGTFFKSEKELLGQIEDYLSNNEERGKIRDNAHNLTTEKHSYVQRAETIINCLKHS